MSFRLCLKLNKAIFSGSKMNQIEQQIREHETLISTKINQIRKSKYFEID
jgi:hypothetical protein